MSKPIQILMVEDNPDDTKLLVRELQRSGFEFQWNRVETEEDYVAKLSPQIDLIISDYELPLFNGLRALELLKKQTALEIPFIIVSGTIGEEMAVAAIQQGAADYLLKDRIGRLGSAIQKALKQVQERRDRKQVEAQFIEAQKMEVVGHLAGGVAHDFNNVLGVIIGYSDLILDDIPPESKYLKYVQEIALAAKRAAGLTQQLLIFSRKQTVQATLMDLNEVVEGLGVMLDRLIDENIEMKIECDASCGKIKADGGYIWQILMNLVVNARDAMPDGGKLTISTGITTLDESYVEDHPGTAPGRYAVLRVADTGIGMTAEIQSRIFEAFYTTKPTGKGTGLGLITCQTIINQSGGHIDVSSEVGKGTTFTIYFPSVSSEAVVPAVDMVAPTRWPRGTETVLVVEDEPSLRHLAQRILEAQGYDVLTSPNGQDALRVAREHQGQAVSLVVTDVVMPRMGGRVMADWLKMTNPGLKVLFTSGYTDDLALTDGAAERNTEFLPKPYTPSELTQRVRHLLDSSLKKLASGPIA